MREWLVKLLDVRWMSGEVASDIFTAVGWLLALIFRNIAKTAWCPVTPSGYL